MEMERSLWSNVSPVRVRMSPDMSENVPMGFMEVL